MAFRGHTENLLSVHSRKLGVERRLLSFAGINPFPRAARSFQIQGKERLPARQN
jgi:hypothetical protein